MNFSRIRKDGLPAFIIVARLVLGGIFLFAGVPKIFSTAQFAETIYNYQILPDLLVNPAAIVLPWIETVTAVCLILGIWIPGSALLTNLLLAVFMAAIVFNYSRGLDIDCGCFSTGNGESISLLTIGRDAFIFLIAILLLISVRIRQISDRKKHGKKN